MLQIRKGTPKDMSAVLDLITELAIFEKEPNAVVITAEDLIRDGFFFFFLFHHYSLKLNVLALLGSEY